jgi:hypothetical protein
MHCNSYKAGLGLCLVILLAGSILQMLYDVSFSGKGSGDEGGLDDAGISCRYAENLVRGEGGMVHGSFLHSKSSEWPSTM